MKKSFHIAILSAMPEEIGQGLKHLINISEFNFGDLKIYHGLWKSNNKNLEINLTLAWSGWGKVSAARASTRIISLSESIKPLDLFIFTGVAGALKDNLKQWDVLLATKLIQHDMDATPIFEKFVIPPLNKKEVIPNKEIINWAENCLNLAKSNKNLKKFNQIFRGLIATGDQFISSTIDVNRLKKEISDISAVEMEGASFGQVVTQEGIPWIVIRVISDNSSEEAQDNFNAFIQEYNHSSWEIIDVLLKDFNKLNLDS